MPTLTFKVEGFKLEHFDQIGDFKKELSEYADRRMDLHGIHLLDCIKYFSLLVYGTNPKIEYLRVGKVRII